MKRRKTRRRRRLEALAIAIVFAACTPVPLVNFGVDGGGGDSATFAPPILDANFGMEDAGAATDGEGPEDAGVEAHDAGTDLDAGAHDAGHLDAGGSIEDAPDDQPGDDGGDGGPTIHCGATLVNNCASCPEGPLRCKRGNVDVCIGDCSSCGTNWLPCLHCPTPDAAPRGTCLPLNADGEINCNVGSAGSLCACNAAADCTVINGSAEVCETVDGGNKKRCLSCGSPTTSGLACTASTGENGTCTVKPDAAPVCE